jgi:hypothetical protein
MHFRSSLVLGIATGFITVCSFGCSPTGGTTVEPEARSGAAVRLAPAG